MTLTRHHFNISSNLFFFQPPRSAQKQDPTHVLTSSDKRTISKKDASVDEAVKRLIDMNKDKLSEQQLVDLLASFYFVTNQCLDREDRATVETLKAICPDDEGENRPPSTIPEPKEISADQTSPAANLTLRDKKQVQWLQERGKKREIQRLFLQIYCQNFISK